MVQYAGFSVGEVSRRVWLRTRVQGLGLWASGRKKLCPKPNQTFRVHGEASCAVCWLFPSSICKFACILALSNLGLSPKPHALNRSLCKLWV